MTRSPYVLERGRVPPSFSNRLARCAALATAFIVAAATGCGAGGAAGGDASASFKGLSAQQILDRANAAVRSARSVHMRGASAAGDALKLDLSLVAGRGGKGTLQAGSGRLDTVLIGEDLYLKADRASLGQVLGKGGAAAAKLLAGRYLKAPAKDGRFKGIVSFLSLPDFVTTLLVPTGSITRVDGKPVDGVATVGLKDEAKQSGGTLYVADDGSALPLLIESGAGAAQGGTLSLGDWNADVPLAPPPSGQVVDLSELPQ